MSHPHDSEAILDAFAVEETHDRATLERYLRKYPELAEELIDLSAELRLAKVPVKPSPERAPDPGLDAAWQEFLTCKPQPATSPAAVNPFANMKVAAFVKLASALNVPRAFLAALRDGLVTSQSIPARFTRRFAEASNVTVELARDYFADAKPEMATLAFKSDVKPSHQGQTTFRALVLDMEMTDEQRQLLLRDCDADGLD